MKKNKKKKLTQLEAILKRGSAFDHGFQKSAAKGYGTAKKRFKLNLGPKNRNNENPLKVPKHQQKVEAAKPGIQHTSGYR